jgi:hypothetical protein
MTRTLSPEQAQAMNLAKARAKLRTDLNAALFGLDRADDHLAAAQLPTRQHHSQAKRLAAARAELEAALQDLPAR